MSAEGFSGNMESIKLLQVDLFGKSVSQQNQKYSYSILKTSAVCCNNIAVSCCWPRTVNEKADGPCCVVDQLNTTEFLLI